MELHEMLYSLRQTIGQEMFEDPDGFRAAVDDFLDEDAASPGEINLLVDAIRLGAYRRMITTIDHGAEPAAGVETGAALLSRERGSADIAGSRWACALLGYAAGKVSASDVAHYGRGDLPEPAPEPPPRPPAPPPPDDPTRWAPSWPPPDHTFQPRYEQPGSQTVSRRPWRGLIAIVGSAVIVASIIVTVVMVTKGGSDDDNKNGNEPNGGSLAVRPEEGECRLLSEGDMRKQADNTEPVDCVEPHTAETFQVDTMRDLGIDYEQYNGENYDRSESTTNDLRAAVKEVCQDAFEDFVGADADVIFRSIVFAAWFMPPRDAWENDEHWVRCDLIAQIPYEDGLLELPEHGEGLLDGVPDDDWMQCMGAAPDYPIVVCSEPHEYRADSTVVLGEDSDPLPSDSEQQSEIDDVCLAPDFATKLNENDWNGGTRKTICRTETTL